jgi:hypothetical protein
MNAVALELSPLITPRAAAEWFLLDMAEVSGFMRSGFKTMSPLSVYGTYRPILTKPDPWYFAGVVALEASAITDIFKAEGADDILREIFAQMDDVVGRDDDDASGLTMMLLGRLGLGSMLMGRKVPENMLARMMMLLIGSDRAMKRVMPDDGAAAQLRTALKSGKPIWWKMFARRYRLTTSPDSAIAARIAVAPGSGPQLPESLGEAQSEDPVMRLDALRVALEKADITIPAAANDAKDVTNPALADPGPQSHDAILEDDLPLEDVPPDDGAFKLDEKYLVD